MEKVDKNKWYEQVADIIEDSLEDFYGKFYKDHDVLKSGKGFRLEPCPMCSHRDCCTIGAAVHCFSCKWSGTHISAWIDYATNVLGITTWEAMKQLEEYSGIPFPNTSKEELATYQKNQKQQQIYRTAEGFYHKQLLNSKQKFELNGTEITPLKYLEDVRMRKMETITSLKIGFSENYPLLRESLKSAGFTDEEIKEAKVWIPEGLFVFFYRNPVTKDIVRINTKNPFKVCYRNFDDTGNESLGDVIQGHSVGNKAFLFSPKFSFKDPITVVEGEHDLASAMEHGCDNVCCIGGNLPERAFEFSLAKAKEKIYLMFDNDHKGAEYADTINEELPHKNIFLVKYDQDYKDPDEYWRDNCEAVNWKDLVSKAAQLETNEFKIYHQGSVWSAANRHKRLDFIITGKKDNGQIIGKASLYINEEFIDRADNVALINCKKRMQPMSWRLSDAMDLFFNKDIEERSNEDLLSIYDNSTKKKEIISLLAKRAYESKDNSAIDNLVSTVRGYFAKMNRPPDNVVDAILKEINSISNNNMTKMGYPTMRICQHFSVPENDAYMYYTVIKHDGDAVRKLPYLLRNNKSSIRLDILKRKDNQCLILVDNKYELPEEVKAAVFNLESCSLTQGVVEKYVDGEFLPEDLCPNRLINRLTNYIKDFYHTEIEEIYKVLALFCFSTYYYTMFPEMPYFHISGHKGSGKTVLDATLEMFCFNASRAVAFSDAALFRKTAIEGGTLILDETESMTTRNKVQESERSAILKGGYSKSNKVWRFNVDKQVTEEFEVYGPKVLSNIFGVEDVLSDRCIPIFSKPVPNSKITKLKSPITFYQDNTEEVKDLTGKICLTALETFQKVYALFVDKDNLFETDTPRLTQIMNPLLAVARLVDLPEKEKLLAENPDLNMKELIGSYEAALYSYYENHIKKAKEEVESSTPEGTVIDICKSIAMEIMGITPAVEAHYTNTAYHKYKGEIEFSKDGNWFELNTIHLKCFMEENNPGDTVYIRQIAGYVKRVYGIGTHRRKITLLENEDLIAELKCGTRPKVAVYRFDMGIVLKPKKHRATADEILNPKPVGDKF